MRPKTLFLLLTIVGFTLLSCSGSVEPEQVAGTYRGVLESPGGELAFPITISNSGDSLQAFSSNGADTVYYNDITVKEDSLILGFDYYDSYLRGKVNFDGSLSGNWSRRAPNGRRSVLPFRAEKGVTERYPETSPDNYNFEGNWKATFTDEDGTFPAQGKFVSQPGGKLFGTIKKETGDYRFLEGFYTDSTLTLSTFDGAHAFLFKAQLQPDGTLKGDLWSRDDYHATWTAEKGQASLRSPLQISAEEAVGNSMEFTFPNLQGDTLRADDPAFQNKPMLVYLFGSWCPNCADETNMLKEIYSEEYSNTDLQIVGLAYEFSGNFEDDAEMVNRYRKRFDIPWTLLVAGVNDKEEAADTLTFLDSVISYPTSFFVDRNHKIRAVHVGFNGPATGSTYFQEIQRFKNQLNQITN
ncbi:TlpA family protein disulfide reductase [Balneolaceae bacterium YR4-1]|uniref:TlpA family protein disulfide reductase n=1 Tax=Halalkalibaculum roseum TaxID=2709311 RepID=A0A6M1T9T6_9BACT|nr:TlpA disulfide reductase family protein [Halalkalibaculum roseum]NGP76993.1 TlpA family protein disulfide reductase [Halalkalibaculum roseum]